MYAPIIDPEPLSDAPPVVIAPGFIIQWLDGGRIYMMRRLFDRPEGFDRWEASLRPVLDSWPLNRRFCILFDIRSPTLNLGLYSGTRIRQIIKSYPQLCTAAAYLYRSRSQPASIMHVMKRIPSTALRTRAFFIDYDTSVRWLHDQFESELQR